MTGCRRGPVSFLKRVPSEAVDYIGLGDERLRISIRFPYRATWHSADATAKRQKHLPGLDSIEIVRTPQIGRDLAELQLPSPFHPCPGVGHVTIAGMFSGDDQIVGDDRSLIV